MGPVYSVPYAHNQRQVKWCDQCKDNCLYSTVKIDQIIKNRHVVETSNDRLHGFVKFKLHLFLPRVYELQPWSHISCS